MTRPFLRLFLTVLLALAVGFFAGLRAAASFSTTDHRRYSPPVPANLALYEPPTTSVTASTVAPVLTAASPPASAPDRPAAGQALRGYAAVHATGRDGLYAAAGPALRAALGRHWRGMRVIVAYRGHWIVVRLSDYCRCDTAEPAKLIDLSDEAWAQLTGRPWGVVRVTVWRAS